MTSTRAGATTSNRTRPQWQPPRCVSIGQRYPKNRGLCGRAAGAQQRLDLACRGGRGKEVALEHAAARLDEELALGIRLDALGDDLEVEAAREGDERLGEAGALRVDRQPGNELAV